MRKTLLIQIAGAMVAIILLMAIDLGSSCEEPPKEPPKEKKKVYRYIAFMYNDAHQTKVYCDSVQMISSNEMFIWVDRSQRKITASKYVTFYENDKFHK